MTELEAILSDNTLKDRYTALVVNDLWTGATRISDGLPVITTQGFIVQAYKLSLLYNKGLWGDEVRTTGPVSSMDPQYLSWYTPVQRTSTPISPANVNNQIYLQKMLLADKYGVTVEDVSSAEYQ